MIKLRYNFVTAPFLLFMMVGYTFYRNYKKMFNLRIPKLSKKEIKGNGDVFFILGSGSSICELSEENFKIISKNFSVGVNRWIFHPFVPNMYSFEYAEGVTADILNSTIRKSKNKTKNSILLCHDSVIQNSGKLHYSFTKNQLKNCRGYFTCRIPAWEEVSFEKILSTLLNKKYRNIWPSHLIFGKRASIERLTYLAIMAGYKKIVFLGVDLDTKYFWECNNVELDIELPISYESGQTGKIHKTNLPQGSLSVSNILKLIQKVTKEEGISLYCGSKNSKLSEILPIYEWKC